MATISKGRFSLQLKISAGYLAVLAAVLILMNIYPLVVSQDLVFREKHAGLQTSAASVNGALAGLDELTVENVAQRLDGVQPEGVSRLVVTDAAGVALYDTEGESSVGLRVPFSEVAEALKGNSAVYSSFEEDTFRSAAAQPVLYRNRIIGAVYVYENDPEQAVLLLNLSGNLMRISLLALGVMIAMSLFFSRRLTRRLGSLQAAIHGVREGAYNQRAVLSGNDEYTQIAGEFNDLVDRLQETESARRQFVSDASHELKTPLAAIRLLTDSILQNENIDSATSREFVSDIGEEAQRLTRITEDLLRLTRLDSGELEAAAAIEVAPVLERVVRMLRPVAEEKEIDLQLVGMGSGAGVVATQGELHQILYNLAENAIKYNRRGGFVRITVQPGQEITTVRVEDNGIGIPQEDLKDVFKRFYRVDKARSRAQGGTGLGLSIVRDTVSRRGGAVWAEARKEGGTCFVVCLPCVEKTGTAE